MLYLDYNEQQAHGNTDFPIAYYHVNENHPRYEMPFHWHKEYEIVMVKEGHFQLMYDDNAIEAESGDCIFIPSGTIHGGIPENCIYECLVFDLDILFIHADKCRYYLKKISKQEIVVNPRITDASKALHQVILRLFSYMSKKHSGYELMVSGCLFEMFGIIFRDQCYSLNTPDTAPVFKRGEQLKSVFEYMENNYSTNISLQQLSQISGMSSKYFCRYFQTIVHKTPMDYLNYYRIERSCSLLCTTDLPITAIAYDCGFNDCSYFIKIFRKYKHITPKQYQKQMKQ